MAYKAPQLPSAENPDQALAAVVALRRLADKLERVAVKRAIEQGWSWSDVAEVLSVSRQAAHKRFAHLTSKETRR